MEISVYENNAVVMRNTTERLDDILEAVKQSSGIQAKMDIRMTMEALSESSSPPEYPNGDDCAVIKNAGGYHLFAIEGFINEFVMIDPWFAGWCGVMVNVSDIAAMGGTPKAVVNALWGSQRDTETTRQVYAGMLAAANAYQVPIVGGHTNLRSNQAQLSVAITGTANTILSSFAAKPDQSLIVAIDLRGGFRAPFLNWDAATSAPPQRLRDDVNLLAEIADRGLATAAKDISQAGILGTVLMLMESSRVGVDFWLDQVPLPVDVEWHDWLQTFPSFGFVLTCDSENTEDLIDLFQQRDICARGCGRINSNKRFQIYYEEQSEEFWNLNQEPFMALTVNP